MEAALFACATLQNSILINNTDTEIIAQKRCNGINCVKTKNTTVPFFFFFPYLLLNLITSFWHILFQDQHLDSAKPGQTIDSLFLFVCAKPPKFTSILPTVTGSKTHLQQPASFPRLSRTKTIIVMAPLMHTSFTQSFYSGKSTVVKTFYL